MLMQKMRDPRLMKGGMWIILIITIPSFVLFYGFGKSDSRGSGLNGEALVTVKNDNGTTKLGIAELKAAEDQYPAELVRLAEAYGVIDPRNTQEEVLNIKRALKPKEKADYAISQLALRERLDKQGIRITDQQVKQVLSDEGITREDLSRILKGRNISEYQFAAEMRESMAANQAAATVSRLARTSLVELYNNYVGTAEKITVTLAHVPAQPDQTYNPSDEEIAAKFKELTNAKDRRTIQEEQRIYDYVKLSIPMTAPDKPTEEQLKAEYDKAPADDAKLIIPASSTLRRIIISFPAGGDEKAKEPAKQKAQQVHDRIAGGEDFATVANEVSEDPTNTKAGENGGPEEKLGGLLPNPVSDNEAAIYGPNYGDFVKSAEINKLSDVIEMPTGYAILRVEGRTPESRMDFEKARVPMTRRVQEQLNQKAADARNAMADEKLKTLRDAARQESTLEGIARAVKSDVRETSPTTSLNTFIPGAGA
ncbi:MAG: peptidylprolyl isomerase, partial [Candidatus Sumerlaeota bacterium]